MQFTRSENFSFLRLSKHLVHELVRLSALHTRDHLIFQIYKVEQRKLDVVSLL